MRDKIVRILWSSPISMNEALSSPLAAGKGLYYITQLYGGKEISLYLGQSGFSIKKRLSSHVEWTQLYRGILLVRVGKVLYPRNATAEIIDHAESAIIYNHGSIFFENTGKIKSYTYYDLFIIENIGDIHQIDPIIRMHDQR